MQVEINGEKEDLSAMLDDCFEIINTYCEDEVKVHAKAVALMIAATTYEEGAEIDYNKVFAFIPLPEGIESIDYNKLIEKILDQETYKDITYTDIDVQYVIENGVVKKEILTMNYEVNLDLMVLANINATGTITLEIEF